MTKHTKDEMLNALKHIRTKTEFYKNLGYNYINGRLAKHITTLLELYDIDLEQVIYNNITIVKSCPVCDNTFVVSKATDIIRPKTTCSHSCSNTYFRSGINNGSHTKTLQKRIDNNDEFIRDESASVYRTICFHYHEKICVVCGEFRIVSVHHYDGNHKNNDPSNLIPLCQTHHQYFHSRFKHIYKEVVDEYRNNWIVRNGWINKQTEFE